MIVLSDLVVQLYYTTKWWDFRRKDWNKNFIKFKGNTKPGSTIYISIKCHNNWHLHRNLSNKQSLLITKETMKHLLSVTVILFCLHISFITEVIGAEVSRSQISRWKRQEAPEDFDCSLCGYCKWERINFCISEYQKELG